VAAGGIQWLDLEGCTHDLSPLKSILRIQLRQLYSYSGTKKTRGVVPRVNP
jgi:hypothetical protein